MSESLFHKVAGLRLRAVLKIRHSDIGLPCEFSGIFKNTFFSLPRFTVHNSKLSQEMILICLSTIRSCTRHSIKETTVGFFRGAL